MFFRRFAFDIITDIMVYAIALIIFSQSAHSLAQVTSENGIDFTVSLTLPYIWPISL